MSFVEPLFFLFIAPVLVALAVTNGRLRITALIIAAYLFYAASYPPYVLVLIAGTLFDYWIGNRIARARSEVGRNIWMAATVASNLGVLIGFKYIGFLVENANTLLTTIGVDFVLPKPSVGLPLGISFFTFQSLSYTIDIYRRVIPPARSLLEFACFVSFFPHLVAGPIIRARDFLPQLENLSPLQPKETWTGIGLIVVGYFKKAVVGDNAGALVDPVFADYAAFGGAAHWLASIFFAIQIYADFSGYTDVATGLSLLLGIRLRENFHWPYLSSSIREFWRRWHMSLSFFLRDYLYIALGGDRRGAARTSGNLLIVWFLGGLWHGAAWHFVAWGLYHGVLVTSGRLMYATRTGARFWEAIGFPARLGVTFLLVTLGWVLFRAASLGDALAMWRAMMMPWTPGWLSGAEIFLGLPLVFAATAGCLHAASYALFRDCPMMTPIMFLRPWARTVAVAMAAFVIIVFAGEARRFIYFDF